MCMTKWKIQCKVLGYIDYLEIEQLPKDVMQHYFR